MMARRWRGDGGGGKAVGRRWGGDGEAVKRRWWRWQGGSGDDEAVARGLFGARVCIEMSNVH